MFAVAQAFTEKDPDGNGKADTFGVGGFINGVGLVTALTGSSARMICQASGHSESEHDSTKRARPELPKALAFFNKLVTAKVIDPDWPTLKRDDFRARWKQGKYGIMWKTFRRWLASPTTPRSTRTGQKASGSTSRAQRAGWQGSLRSRRSGVEQHLLHFEKAADAARAPRSLACSNG